MSLHAADAIAGKLPRSAARRAGNAIVGARRTCPSRRAAPRAATERLAGLAAWLVVWNTAGARTALLVCPATLSTVTRGFTDVAAGLVLWQTTRARATLLARRAAPFAVADRIAEECIAAAVERRALFAGERIAAAIRAEFAPRESGAAGRLDHARAARAGVLGLRAALISLDAITAACFLFRATLGILTDTVLLTVRSVAITRDWALAVTVISGKDQSLMACGNILSRTDNLIVLFPLFLPFAFLPFLALSFGLSAVGTNCLLGKTERNDNQ